jgi:phospholipase/carboxylesterase
MKAVLSLLILTVIWSSSIAQFPIVETESYAERAEAALRAGDYVSSTELYQLWLEADPDDRESWYNFACALALNSDTTNAITALQNAVELGWRDSSWTSRDADLASLHDRPEFSQLLTRMGQLVRDEQSTTSAASLRYATQERLGPYLIDFPTGYNSHPEKYYPLLVLQHGRNNDMVSMDMLRERLALPGVIVAQPQAPYQILNSRDGYEYWPNDLRADETNPLLAEARNKTADWTHSIIQTVNEGARVDPDNVYVIGFSQGAAAASVAGIEHGSSIRGFGMIAGYIPVTHADSTNYDQLLRNDVSVFIAHGRRDQGIQIERMESVSAELSGMGVDSEFHAYPAGHEITDEMIVDLADWLTRMVATPKRPQDQRGIKVAGSQVSPVDPKIE